MNFGTFLLTIIGYIWAVWGLPNSASLQNIVQLYKGMLDRAIARL